MAHYQAIKVNTTFLSSILKSATLFKNHEKSWRYEAIKIMGGRIFKTR